MFITKTRTAMENHDKIYTQFKEASGAQEQKGFDRMEAVWNRVEEKLDRKKERKAAIWWKYTGIAAVMLLFITIGLFMLQPNNAIAPKTVPATNVTVIDTQKVKETFKPENFVPKEKQEQVVVTQNPAKEEEFRIKGEIVKRVNDSVYFSTKAKFTTTKNDAPEYHFKAGKMKFVPGIKVVENITSGSIVINDSIIKNHAKGNAAIVFNGTVVDHQGMPIPGVKVAVAGSKATVLTDFDGNYAVNTTVGDTLRMSYIGMQEANVIANSKNNSKTVALNENTVLGDVVVTGYRSTTRALATTAVTTITSKSIAKESRRNLKEREKQEKAATKDAMTFASPATAVTTVTSKTIQGRPNANFVQSLQGQVPGLNVTTGDEISFNTKTKKARVWNSRTDQGEFRVTGDVTKRSDKEANDYNYSTGDINLNNTPSTAATQALQGRAAGVAVTPANGQPGANSTVVLRGIGSINGNQEPLYVIDGVPMNIDNFRKLNPNNIKSIQVLKNTAATSLYGSRGYNGVIVVNTKDGKGISAKERRQMKREQRRAAKETSASQKDFEKAQEAQRKANEAGERERQKAFEAESKRRMTEKIKVDHEEYESFEENRFENPATAPLSTFSIDVDNASYTNIRRFINNGETVPKDAVRVEEMINFFKYSYAQPTGKDPFAINTEYSDCPWNPQHKLLKIGLQGKDIPQAELPASNFVFLIDVSGSMDAQNKLPLLKESMKILVKQMRAKDRIAIIVYAGAAGMVLPSTRGSEKAAIIAALDKLNAGGSTAGGAGIELAYKTAQEYFIKGGNNRVILATDGDFNVGASSDKDMQTLIEEKRKSGVFLTCLGYGMGNYKDSKLETLSDKGNGNYAYIDNMDEADRFLDKEFRGSMYAIAKDVKIQIEFNPNHVQAYRLIGYENRKLRNEDFTNDAIDAGELGSGHTVTALYEIIPPGIKDDFTTATDLKYSTVQPTGTKYSSELATVKFRYKKPDGDTSTEMVHVIQDTAQPLMNATGDFKFAAAVAWFGLKLRDSKLVPNKDIEAIKKLAHEGRNSDPEGYRAEFIRLAGRIE
jgi:Ca-activated chloride channel family protein